MLDQQPGERRVHPEIRYPIATVGGEPGHEGSVPFQPTGDLTQYRDLGVGCQVRQHVARQDGTVEGRLVTEHAAQVAEVATRQSRPG